MQFDPELMHAIRPSESQPRLKEGSGVSGRVEDDIVVEYPSGVGVVRVGKRPNRRPRDVPIYVVRFDSVAVGVSAIRVLPVRSI